MEVSEFSEDIIECSRPVWWAFRLTFSDQDSSCNYLGKDNQIG